MKQLHLNSTLAIEFNPPTGAVLADGDASASGTIAFRNLAKPPFLYIYEIDGMFKGTLIQGPRVRGVSVAICRCKVRPSNYGGDVGYVGRSGDAFMMMLIDDPIVAGRGSYVLIEGTGKLTGLKGNGNWTFDNATLTGTYAGVTEID